MLCILLCSPALAEESIHSDAKPLLSNLKMIEVSGPYCGIYSLIAILDTLGIHPNPQELLTKEFVGSLKGSSNLELEKAAEKFGLYAKTYSGLTWRELKTSESSMILHFRSTYADSQFDHWVACLGVDGGKARIIDLPHRLTTIPFAELLAKWDGTARLAHRMDICLFVELLWCCPSGRNPGDSALFIQAQNWYPSPSCVRSFCYLSLLIRRTLYLPVPIGKCCIPNREQG